jgi:microcystin degradation protein MlrC
MLLDRIRRAMPFDGLYLDLHGAMVAEHLEDGEGELLRRVRGLVGDALPITVSLDLHANVTPGMVRSADVLEIFRTYPHVDMGETGARAAAQLVRMIESGLKPCAAFRQVGFMLPLNWGCTLTEPCRGIYQRVPEVIGGDVWSASIASGFHLSDIHHVGPSVVTYADSGEVAERVADELLAWVERHEGRFNEKIWPAREGVTEALRLCDQGRGTVVLADTQDNPGGGGSGDTTGLLQELVNVGAAGAVFGVLADPLTVERARKAGVGGVFDAALGGRSGFPGQAPYECSCRVLSFASGSFTATGPMYHGAHMVLGPCALLETGGVRVLVSSHPVQVADQAIFRHFGIEPADEAILALKSSVHFRNDFTEPADVILVVAAPGAVVADPTTLDYQRKRPGVRLLSR